MLFISYTSHQSGKINTCSITVQLLHPIKLQLSRSVCRPQPNTLHQIASLEQRTYRLLTNTPQKRNNKTTIFLILIW